MKKIFYGLFIIMLCLFTVACNSDKVSIESELVFDYFSENDLSIETKNVESISSIIYDQEELSNDLYEFLNSKIYIENSFLKTLGYGEYDFQVKISNTTYDIKIYICDSREPKLLAADSYKYSDKDISIPYTNYNAKFEMYYNGETMTAYRVEDGNLIIPAEFIELCEVEDIEISYKFTYRTMANPKKDTVKEGTINIEKILFGDIEW